MKTSILFMLLLLTVVPGMADGKPTLTIVALPRPNSGTFSFQQAEARKSEILSNAPTAKTENWKNPYMGFRIHIDKDDSLEVYDHWMKKSPEYSKPRIRQSVADIKKLADELPLEGNPAGVLITSEVPLKSSKVIHDVLKTLLIPSVQLFYVRSSEPNGPANGSQPFRSQTNSISSGAGSRR